MNRGAFVFLLLILCGCMPDYEKVEIPKEGYDLIKNVSKEWNHVCLSSQYEIPDLEFPDNVFSGASCWNGNEVPSRSIAISYIHTDNTCTLKMVSGDFLSKQNSETRCFSQKFVKEKKLTLFKQNSIVSFEWKDTAK